MEQFSTAGLVADQTLSFWNDLAESTLGPMTIDTKQRESFHASLERIRLRDYDILSPKSMPASIESRGDQNDEVALNLHFQHRGSCWTRIGDEVHLLGPGDFMVYDLSLPFRVEFDQPIEGIVIRLPDIRMAERLPRLRHLAGIPGRGDKGAGAILSGFVRNAWEQLKADENAEWADTVGEVIWPLIDAAYSRTEVADVRNDARAERRRQLFVFINGNLTDPDLSTGEIAKAMGVSARVVQLTFAEIGTTPSSYIQARRLDNVAAELGRMGNRISITRLAFDTGFNDLSSFCRSFRQRFGITAREYRAGVRPKLARGALSKQSG